ncbi:orotate phosphoribosyltransferase [Bacillaceae bacterium SIJ1]|uniref:orotate phosphoribosyltransferase n=1 Tax=Litoribacterium kuwaitense TaxID=1398745 RepID=UPI0013EE0F2A|nr:orotate phosphoribosyltransferase [Litoribacterium kuwaitense]NGP44313.1 orotate phosphoribosyltransferase [Litoribacterium kuwaitense]
MDKQVAAHLLDIGAVSIQPDDPFTWSSGLKAPIYCDNRLLISYPAIRREVAQALGKRIQEEFGGVDVIAGTATAGIPHAAWISDVLDLPMVYVRGQKKAHGTASQIEGVIKPGQRVIVIEDLISTGRSALSAVEALRSEGAEVLGIASIFTYEMEKSMQQCQDLGIECISLTTITALLEVAQERGMKADQASQVLEWTKSPEKTDWVVTS